MKRIIQILLLLVAIQSSASEIVSSASEEKRIRILELFPETWLKIPGIEPAIPENYVLSQEKNGSIFWGTQEDLDHFFHDEKSSIKSAIFAVTYVPATDEKEIKASLKEIGTKKISVQKMNWGEYPILSIGGILEGKFFRMAVLDLNEDNLALFIKMIPPQCDSKNNSQKLWNDFLKNTKPLDEQAYFKTKGLELQEGFTIHRVRPMGGVKVIAEKRKSDNQLVVMIQPLDSITTFEIYNIFQALLGTQWKYGQPCIKIEGLMKVIHENSQHHINCVLTVHPKIVDEYSFATEKKDQNTSVFTLKSEF